MELLCIEIESEPRGYLDPVFLDDDRVLGNLLLTEERYTISSSYFSCFQTELQDYMRKIVCSWMLEVCEEEKCQEEVFPLAMNIMDRFLSVVRIRKNQLQLLGAVCLFLASKLRQTRPLDSDKLVVYTDYSISSEELLGWELLVLSRLKWDLAAITPNDFVNPLIRRLMDEGYTKGNEMLVKRHTQTFIALCAADFNFSMQHPSIVAAACISTAIMGLRRSGSPWTQQQQLYKRLKQLTGIEVDVLRECQMNIESMIASHVPASGHKASDVFVEECHSKIMMHTVHSEDEDSSNSPVTPTDVQDVDLETKRPPDMRRFHGPEAALQVLFP